jgi:hypothetical protein
MISMGRRITQLEPTLHWQAVLQGRDVLEREPVLANIYHGYSNRCDLSARSPFARSEPAGVS